MRCKYKWGAVEWNVDYLCVDYQKRSHYSVYQQYIDECTTIPMG